MKNGYSTHLTDIEDRKMHEPQKRTGTTWFVSYSCMKKPSSLIK